MAARRRPPHPIGDRRPRPGGPAGRRRGAPAGVRRWLGGLLLAGGLAVGALPTSGWATPAPTPPTPAPAPASDAAGADVALDSLRAGERGYALTAGPGGILERFAVEVLGLQYDPGGGFPLVLVRTSGAFIDAAGGVAAGMSGSPVYLRRDGTDALLGAIGYVFPEADPRVALVTPIGAMRDAAQARAPSGTPRPAAFGPALAELGRRRPVATPVLMSGLSPRAAALLEPLFADAAVRPLAAPGGVAPNAASDVASDAALAARDADFRLEPGAAVSVQLARGDVTVAAVGTLTALDGARLLAFGHPLLGEGPVSFPVAPAYITAIVASPVVPFKLANSGRRLLGVVTEDRPAALAGSTDAQPALLPLHLTLGGAGGQRRLTVELARDERYYPLLSAAVVLEALDEALGRLSGGTAELAWDIGLADGSSVRVLEQVSDPRDVALASARLAGEPLALLADNAFRAAEVERVSLAIEVDDEQRVAELLEATLERDTVPQGGTVVAHLRLQPFRRPAVVRSVTLPLPEHLSGELTLTFRGGNDPHPDGDEESGEPPLLSFTELLVALRENLQASELVVELDTATGERQRLERVPLPFLLRGSERVTLHVTPAPPADEAESTAAGDDPAADPPLSGTPDPDTPDSDPPAPPVGPGGQLP